MQKLSFKSSITWFLLLAYMAVGVGSADAFLWCVEQDGFSHVEYNPGGECRVTCDSEQGIQGDGPGAILLGAMEAKEPCQDFSAASPLARNGNKTFQDNILSIDGKVLPSATLMPPLIVFVRIGLGPQPPPPSPTLTTLRTVVLLI